MTQSDDKNVVSNQKLIKKNREPLPWWVELLFVQIGLPENYLTSFLKFKNYSKEHLEAYRNRYFLILTAMFTLIYINPLIKNAINNNICISNFHQLSKSQVISTNKSNLDPLTNAVHYCNGGDSLE